MGLSDQGVFAYLLKKSSASSTEGSGSPDAPSVDVGVSLYQASAAKKEKTKGKRGSNTEYR